MLLMPNMGDPLMSIRNHLVAVLLGTAVCTSCTRESEDTGGADAAGNSGSVSDPTAESGAPWEVTEGNAADRPVNRAVRSPSLVVCRYALRFWQQQNAQWRDVTKGEIVHMREQMGLEDRRYQVWGHRELVAETIGKGCSQIKAAGWPALWESLTQVGTTAGESGDPFISASKMAGKGSPSSKTQAPPTWVWARVELGMRPTWGIIDIELMGLNRTSTEYRLCAPPADLVTGLTESTAELVSGGRSRIRVRPFGEVRYAFPAWGEGAEAADAEYVKTPAGVFFGQWHDDKREVFGAFGVGFVEWRGPWELMATRGQNAVRRLVVDAFVWRPSE